MIFTIEILLIILGTFVLLFVYSAAAVSSRISRYEEEQEISKELER